MKSRQIIKSLLTNIQNTVFNCLTKFTHVYIYAILYNTYKYIYIYDSHLYAILRSIFKRNLNCLSVMDFNHIYCQDFQANARGQELSLSVKCSIREPQPPVVL